MSNEQWLKRLRFGDHHANKARATWETAPTMVNTFTTGHVLGLAQGGEHAVKALVYYANRQPGRHGLVGMWNALPVEPDIRQRFASFVHRCGAVPAQGPYPETEAFRLHTKERTVQDWFRFIQRGAELTDFVLRVGAHVRDGAPTSTGWRRT